MQNSDHSNSFSAKLNLILEKICQGMETPQALEADNDNIGERLIERLEIQNYPYPALTCSHQEELQIGEDCVACQALQYETHKSRFFSLAEEKGYGHVHTLKAAFDYNSSLITQYRLTECDELLDAVYDACISRGSWSVYYLMAIQARAFLRFKQGQYKESIDYFKMQLELMGPNEHIYENMALAYTRINEYAEASSCYGRAILMTQKKPPEQQEFATLLIGLSTVLHDTEDALTVLETGMELLKAKYAKPHSLMAKTLTAMADLHLKRDDFIAAEQCYSEAVTIFIDTCGYETPLTSNAMTKHGELLFFLQKKAEAKIVFLNALKVWTNVDDYSFEPNMVMKILLVLRDLHNPETTTNEDLNETLNALIGLQNKIANSQALSTDLNVLCLLKFMYELKILYGKISAAIECCKLFLGCLDALDETNLGELSSVRSQLHQEASEILALMQTIP